MKRRANPGELLVASNPSGRRRRRKGQSAKQRAASLRNLKKARRGKRRHHAVASNPSPRRKRRRSSGYRRIARRRNPIKLPKLGLGRLKSQVMPALVGGAGAVGNDVLYNVVLNALPATTPMLDQFRTGALRHVGKAGSAMLLSWAAGLVLGRRTAEQLGAGALTVVGYNVVRDLAMRFAPSLNLGMFLDPSGATVGLGRLGAYANAGWNATYGSNWRQRSGLSAYVAAGGASPGPGGLVVPNQFDARSPFGMRSEPVYADEFEVGT